MVAIIVFFIAVFWNVSISSFSNKTHMNIPVQLMSFEEFKNYKNDALDVIDHMPFLTHDWHYYLKNHTVGFIAKLHHSTQQKSLGSYFGINNKNTFILGDSLVSDAFLGLFTHPGIAGIGDRTEQITLLPRQSLNEIMFYYIIPVSEKLCFKVQIPCSHVIRSLNPSFESQGSLDRIGREDVKNFFMGNYQNSLSTSLQNKLEKGKFYLGKKTITEISNIFVSCSYETEYKNLGFNVGTELVLPLGSKDKTEYLFSPETAFDHHVGMGGQVSCTVPLLSNLTTTFLARAFYWFDCHQTRLIGLQGMPYGQYVLLGKNGDVRKPLIPAANILARSVRVSKDFSAFFNYSLAYNLSVGVKVNIGYECSVHKPEKITLVKEWEQGTWGVASSRYNTSLTSPFGSDSAHFYSGVPQDWLKNDDLDLKVSALPEQIIHHFATSLTKEHICSLGNFSYRTGIFYDYSSTNASASHVGGWVGITAKF